MGDTKNSDEVFCQSCGEKIKRKAEICPECGVRNETSNAGRSKSGTATRGSGSSQRSGNQTSTEAEPSDSWVLGIKIGAGIWGILAILMLLSALLFRGGLATMGGGAGAGFGRLFQSLALAGLIPILQFGGWIVVGMSMYGDIQYIDYHTDEWPLNGSLYIAGAILLPILTQIFGVIGFLTGGIGIIATSLIPLLLFGMCIRHLHARNKMLSPDTS